MKTLLLNGSPKRNGDTDALVKAFTEALEGEIRILTAEDSIRPCIDCRYCRKNPGCALQDDMQEVYRYLLDCDAVAIASPVWFSSLSGPLLNMASRMQTYFSAAHFRGEAFPGKKKNGVLLLVGAEPGTEKIPAQNARTILKLMNVQRPLAAEVYSMRTDDIPAKEDEKALSQAREAALLLNRLSRA